MRWCGTEGNEMVWDGGSDTLVVPKRWALIRVALGGAPVGPCSVGVGFMERSVGRCLCVTYRYQYVAVKHEIKINNCNIN